METVTENTGAIAQSSEKTCPEVESKKIAQPIREYGIVHSKNEWGQLKEVVVGRVDNFRIPPNELHVVVTIPDELADIVRARGGEEMPSGLIEKANQELNEFIKVLEGLGVNVKRPEIPTNKAKLENPLWTSNPFGCACVRDGCLIIDDKIIETPMSWRCRYNELLPLKGLFNKLFNNGAQWLAAPKPLLLDSLYNHDYAGNEMGKKPYTFIINESEIVFDAADFTRCGYDIFTQMSHTTNLAGINWLRRTLGDKYRIHILDQKCTDPVHIDVTFIPIGPKRVLINPNYIDYEVLPDFVKNEWEVLLAPQPVVVKNEFSDYNICSDNLSTNILMVNPNLAIVDKNQTPLIELLESKGIKVIGINANYLSPFGGSFHCFTLDLYREDM